MAYAARTSVPVSQTKSEIESLLRKYGADLFHYGLDSTLNMAAIMFRFNGRQIRFRLPLPPENEAQAVRSKWRALMLCVKAKLESVESEIETFDQAFMAHVVLPDNSTVAEWLEPQLVIAYQTGKMPAPMLQLEGPKG